MALGRGTGRPFGRAFLRALQDAGNPRPSYRAKTWVGQLRQLMGTEAGYRAMGDAGVSANRRTLTQWLNLDHAPSKRNQSAIHEAYTAMQRGKFPRVRNVIIEISGVVRTGRDQRTRGDGYHAPLRVDGTHGHWDRIEDWWESGSDDYDELGFYVAEDLVAEDLGDGTEGGWEFPSGTYTVIIR